MWSHPNTPKSDAPKAASKADEANTSRVQTLRAAARQVASPLPPFMLEAQQVANTVAAGLHGRRRSGQGDSFWQFRMYQDGDSSSQIDWRRSAMSQRTYVREREWETAQTVWIWRDSSPSMHFRSSLNVSSKLDRGTILALACVVLLTQGGEQVSVLSPGARPQSGPGVVGRLAEALVHMEGEADTSQPPFVEIPKHAELIWVGDFLSDLTQTEDLVRRYAQWGCRGHLVQVLDRAEMILPYTGQVIFHGLEGDGMQFVSQVNAIRDVYMERFTRHQEALAFLARSYNWTHMTHFTDQSTESALLSVWSALNLER